MTKQLDIKEKELSPDVYNQKFNLLAQVEQSKKLQQNLKKEYNLMSARGFYTKDTNYENRLDQEIQKLNNEINQLQA